MSPRAIAPLALLTLALAWHAPAAAQSIADEAEVQFGAGVEAYRRSDFQSALLHFMQSNRLSPNPVVAANVGHAYTAMRKYPEAYRWYSSALQLSDEGNTAQIQAAMDSIAPQVVLISLESEPPGATVYLEKRSLGSVATTPATIALPEGSYTFIFDRDDHRSFETETQTYDKVGTKHTISPTLDAITGTLKVTGDEGVEVLLGSSGGEVLCTVPCDKAMPVGPVGLRLVREGYRTLPLLVEIEEGQTAEVDAKLEVISGQVRIDANVLDALVTVDNTAAGYTPAIVTAPVGTRTLTISATGYESQTVSVDVTDTEVTDVGVVRLQPKQVVSLASRVEEDLFTAPSSVSVVTRDELDAFGYPTVTEALRGVRGITAINADLSSMAMVRGVGTAANRGSQTRVLQDGVPLSDQLAGQQYIWTRNQSYDRIEVQRGSGSVLYGGGAMTGVISLRTRGRVTEPVVEGSLGSFGSEARFNGMAGGALDTERETGAWVSVGGAYGEGDEATIVDFPTGGTNASGDPILRDRTVDAYAPWRALNVDGRAWTGDLELQTAYSIDRVEVTSGSEGAVFEDRRNGPNNPTELSNLTLKAQWQPSLSERTDLELSGHYRDRSTDSGALWVRPVADSELLLDVAQETRAQWVGGTAQVVSNPTDEIRVVAGTEAYRALELSVHQENTIRPSDAAAVIDFRDLTSVYAAYGVADVTPVRFFKASAGLRVDKWNAYAAQFNPRLVAMALPTEDDVLKLMVGRAFRAPVLFEQKYFVESISIPALDLAPEHGWSYEAEYAHRVDSWTGLVSGWGASYQDSIVSSFDETIGLARYRNTGSTRVWGADVELRRDFLAGWMLSTWYSYQVPRIIDDNGTVRPSPEQPEHLAALKLVAPVLPPALSAAVRVVYEGERPYREGTEGEAPDGVLADLVLSGRSRDRVVDWRAGVYNVLDTNFSAATTNSTPSATLPQTTGRTFMATITLRGRKRPDEL